VSAINRGDRVTAAALAGELLAVDQDNTDAEDLLAASGDAGEIRRLTILFADLVDSTVLSGRVEPETYRLLVGRYREHVCQIVDRYGGHIGSTKGDGLLAVFGHPTAHDNDVRRAVQAGLETTREVTHLSQQARRWFGVEIAVSGCIAVWCTWTPPKMTYTGLVQIWPRGYRAWPRRGLLWFPRLSRRWCARTSS
jgi:class 3 adenylate cyclase